MTPERIAELIPQALTGYYGHKCKDFNDNCICCQAWAELSRLTRERDEAYNAGIEAAANVSIGSVARLPQITNTHKIAEICQFDPLQGWITKEDVIRYGSEITDGIRELKKPATGQATGEK